MPSLKGGGTLSLHNVQVNGLKLFSAVSKATGKDSIDNPNLKKVEITTRIANNVMTIERTRMRVFGFRPRMEGQVTLDGKLNLQFRLGLPPFGIIGIPMSITGTSENPIVKMRRGKDEDELEETVDEKD
jgi:AsmA protein